MRTSTRSLTQNRIPSEYFQDSYNVACWPLLPGYGLMDTVGGNHLIAPDVLSGIGVFTSWGSDNPTGWTFNKAEDASNYCTQNPAGKAQIVAANLSNFGLTKGLSLVAGKTYESEVDIDTVASGGIYVGGGAGTAGNTYTTTGHKIGRFVADSTTFYCGSLNTGATNVTIDNLTVREVYNGNISSEGAYFNGVSNQLRTTNNVNLSTQQIVTVYADIKLHTYDKTGATAHIFISLSINPDNTNGAFGIYQHPVLTGDPIGAYSGNLPGFSAVDYVTSNSKCDDKNFHLWATSVNKTLTTNEVNISIDGKTLVADVRRFNVNLTGNLANQPMYFGGPVTGYSTYTNCSLKNILVRSAVDSPETIADYYAWQKDTRRANFWSLFIPPVDVFSPPSKFPKLALDVNGDDTLIIADITKDQSKDAPKNVKQREFFEGN